MTTAMSPIDVITASAGTGKTTRLTQAYQEVTAHGVAPEQILLATFTRKAAAEVIERVRAHLLKEGRYEEAQRVFAGYAGTVNAVFGHLVSEFALEAGRAPVADVIPEKLQQHLFRIAADSSIERYADQLQHAATRASVEDWRADVLRVCDAARQNDIPPAALASFAQRSWGGLRQLLPPLEKDEALIDDELRQALDRAARAIEAGSDSTKVTAEALIQIKSALAAFQASRPLKWDEWARLSKLKSGKASQPAILPVTAAASRHPQHPRLHRDLQTLITGIFACAAESVQRYQEFKNEQGLVDFVDQEKEALALLSRDELSSHLRQRIRIALVDEFQDTSPIQLALFLRLARIVERSTWVGDPKQAIYGFRGTDPELMREAANHLVGATGGTLGILDKSYRSRPALGAFVNDAFEAAFPRVGIPAEQVRIQKFHRHDLNGQGIPLEAWHLQGNTWEAALDSLAAGVSELLANAEKRLVGEQTDDGGEVARKPRGLDIAVLCRYRDRCETVAKALANAGLRVSIGRPGLLATPEAGLAIAALRYLVDPFDSLASAEIEHLTWDKPGQPDWFEHRITRDQEGKEERPPHPALSALDQARPRLPHLTPTESLDMAIRVANLDDHVKRWPEASQRLANLDALRGLAKTYEDECQSQRIAATATGFIGFLSKVDEEDAQPPSTDPDAVQVMTYHGAKGLEWPIVILLDLQSGPRPSPFGVVVEPPEGGFDPIQPLAGRWIRYWPWPYGKQAKDVHLDQTSQNCPEMGRATRREFNEAIRLLYVGTTRARDYLVLATTRHGTAWLDTLVDKDGRQIISLPVAGAKPAITANGKDHPVQYAALSPPDAQANVTGVTSRDPRTIPTGAAPATTFPPYRVTPSSLMGVGPSGEYRVKRNIDLGPRLPITGSADLEHLGQALHAFIAADKPRMDAEKRLALARQILGRWGVTALQPEQLLEASDRLWRWIDGTYSGARVHREYPVNGRIGMQRATGKIDLLIEAADGFVVIDHKSFPGRVEDWEPKALSFAPQLQLYRDTVVQASSKEVRGLFVHMPIVGRLLEIERIG